MANGRDAFLARLALIENAKHTLDIQYYIWHDDISGRLLVQRILASANRGVKVRMLLDDHTMAGMDNIIATLNQHENIEVRLFNPYMQRYFHPMGYLSDFFRLNRRMHNKSLTADGLISVVGGRNIGDEYFDATSSIAFADLDVAVIGNGASQTANDFDTYWNHQVSYPAELIIGDKQIMDLSQLNDKAKGYLELLKNSDFANSLLTGELDLIWANAKLVSDNPDKALNKGKNDNLFNKHIAPLMANTKEQLLIVSPYFVPTKQGEEFLSELAQEGKEVHILTNSLMANDVAVVHSGYAKYRKDLLKNGVNLYELKPDATIKPAKIASVYDGQGESLHAKTFSIDGRYLYVGSFNFDPRSANLNTEMGFIIENEFLAKQLQNVLSNGVAQHTYQVSLNDKNNLEWQTIQDGQLQTSEKEPESSLSRRMQVWIASHLPIEWLL